MQSEEIVQSQEEEEFNDPGPSSSPEEVAMSQSPHAPLASSSPTAMAPFTSPTAPGPFTSQSPSPTASGCKRKRHASSPDASFAEASTSTLQAARELLADISASKQKRRDSSQEGEFYFYSMHLAKRLEKLNPEAALECTRQIDEILHNFSYANLHS